MDWIRRNWPDLLIGIALMAVIAGIIATLLTGGSFFPLGSSGGGSDREAQPSIGSLAGTVEAGTSERRSSVAPDSSGDRDDEATGARRVAPTGSGPVEVTVLPLTSSGSDASSQSAPESTPSNEASAASPASSSAVAAGREEQASTRAAERSGGRASTQPLAASGGVEEPGSYRISVGAFSSPENAERQAGRFREAGYPVFTGRQGTLSLVLVGPYGGHREAEQVAERIRAEDFGIEPVIYLFRPGAAQASGESSSAAASAPKPQQPAQAVAAPKPSASQASGARFLQVGAYGSSESAGPQRERLEGLGFRVTERVEGDLVKLLVGPFAGAELSQARTHLTEQGVDHFPR